MVSDYAAHAHGQYQYHCRYTYHITYAHRYTSAKSLLWEKIVTSNKVPGLPQMAAPIISFRIILQSRVARTPRHSHLSPDLHVAGDLAYLAAATLVSVTIRSPG